MMVQLAKANGIVPIVPTIIPAGKPEARIGDFSVADSWSNSTTGSGNMRPIIHFLS